MQTVASCNGDIIQIAFWRNVFVEISSIQIFIRVCHFNMNRLQQCCLFHDHLLPLLCTQGVASETSTPASNPCVATKKRIKHRRIVWPYVIKARLALVRASVAHIQCSPGWSAVGVQQHGSGCTELQVSKPKVKPAQLLHRLSLRCWPTRHSWLKNRSSRLYQRWSPKMISLHKA